MRLTGKIKPKMSDWDLHVDGLAYRIRHFNQMFKAYQVDGKGNLDFKIEIISDDMTPLRPWMRGALKKSFKVIETVPETDGRTTTNVIFDGGDGWKCPNPIEKHHPKSGATVLDFWLYHGDKWDVNPNDKRKIDALLR